MASQWANLPSEILSSIFIKLLLKDFIRCGAVCISWCSVVKEDKEHYCNTKQQISWLMLPNLRSKKKAVIQKFFDLGTKEIHNIRLPELRKSRVIGSSECWIIAADETTANIYALNPITRSRIDFAPGSTLPRIIGKRNKITGYYIDGGMKRFHVSPEELTWKYFRNAVLSTTCCISPAQGRGGIDTPVVVLVYLLDKMAFTREGDATWTELDLYDMMSLPESLMFHKDLLYVMYSHGRVVSYKLTVDDESQTHSVLPLLLVPNYHPLENMKLNRCLVGLPNSSGSDDLFQICWFPGDAEETCILFRLERTVIDGSCWVQVDCLPHDVTFLVNWHFPCTSTTLYAPGNSKFIKKHCLYFPRERCIKVFQLGEGRLKRIFYGENIRSKPQDYGQPSIWITPSIL